MWAGDLVLLLTGIFQIQSIWNQAVAFFFYKNKPIKIGETLLLKTLFFDIYFSTAG